MADNSDNGASNPDDQISTFAGYAGYNEFSQAVFSRLMLSTRHSNALPSEGVDFDYYSSFTSVQQAMDMQGTRLLSMIQDLMRYYGVRGNVSAGCQLTDIDDRLDAIVDANDQLLERVGTHLDEAAGLRKDASLVVVTQTPKASPLTGQSRSVSMNQSGSSGFRLLTAKNIARPQLSFKDKIDNVNRPFVPSITTKPNALKSLEDSMICELPADSSDIDPGFSYPHPYQFELDHLVPNTSHFKKCEPCIPSSLDIPASFIDTEDGLVNLCNVLKREKEIAVDLENHSFRSFQGFTCLMQISSRSRDYIVDVLKLRHKIYLLNEIFTNPDILKVFHGADLDILWLQRDFGVYVVNMFDTGQASRILGFPKYSLAYLLDKYCSVTADKQYQVADWRIRPLPEEFLKYAREDTHYLLYIYDRLKNDLIDSDKGQNSLISNVFSRSIQICSKRYSKPRFTENCYRELHRQSKKVFNSKQMEALKGLYAWRDQLARLEDESIGYILPNHMMLQIAELLPREPSGILACCNPLPPLVRQHVMDLHEIIKRTKDKPQLLLNPKKQEQQRPTQFQHPKYFIDVLSCPHDLSHTSLTKTTDTDCSILVTTKSTASVPGIIARQINSEAIKACKIAATFVNPFTKYLPEDLLHDEESKEKLSALDKSSGQNLWKLVPNTVKAVGTAPSHTIEVIKTAPILEFGPDSEETSKEDVVVLRDMVSNEKRTSRLLESLAGENNGLAPELNKRNKQKRKTDNIVEIVEDSDEESEGFNYDGKAFESLIQGESSKSKPDRKKKKKNDYNPNDAQMSEPDVKTAAKPRFTHPAKSKSMTYSKDSRASRMPKIPWPSK